MTDYLYVPFPEDPGKGAGAQIVDLQVSSDVKTAKARAFTVIYSNLSIWDNSNWDGQAIGHFINKQGAGLQKISKGIRVLSVVKPGDFLMITGHGVGEEGQTPAANLIAAKVQKDSNAISGAMTAATLAARIKKEGLTTEIKDVSVAICFSGIDGKIITKDNINPVTGDCFASLIARELGKLGYKKIEVVGYLGSVTPTKTGGSLGTVYVTGPNGTTAMPMQFACRVFNWEGKAIVQ